MSSHENEVQAPINPEKEITSDRERRENFVDMQCYTWQSGKLREGFSLQTDQRLGPVVFLGEAGRGRRFELVSLDRRNPAQAIDGRVREAHPRKVTLPARDGKAEKTFWVLERASIDQEQRVLVRISTQYCYTRDSRGYWTTEAGTPETLTSGYGAHGDAGRIGNWNEGLIVVKPGDVLRIKPEGGHKSSFYALWLDERGQLQTALWQDYENLMAVAKAEKLLDEKISRQEALPIVFGQMPCLTWECGRLVPGISLQPGATGQVIARGEQGRGRQRLEIPLVGIQATERIESAAIAKIESVRTTGNKSGGAETKVTFALTNNDRTEDAFLVRVNTSWVYTRGTDGSFKIWKGRPELVGGGAGAHGIAGYLCSWQDGLVVLHEGDVLLVSPEGGRKTQDYALFVEDGELKTQPWISWKLADAQRDPAFYVEKNTAPWGHVPSEWLGRIVTVKDRAAADQSGSSHESLYDLATGELLSLDPLVLNLGWDARGRLEKVVPCGAWVVLEQDKRVCVLEGAELETRTAALAVAKQIQETARQLVRTPSFSCLPEDVQKSLSDLAASRDNTSDWSDHQAFELMRVDELERWSATAGQVLEKSAASEDAAKELHDRRERKEILIDFGGHFRVMGATGQADYWVVRADGSLREPDAVQYRRRYTDEGDKTWRLVAPEELALTWTKSFTAAEHEFRVEKLPLEGCTREQRQTVERLTREISERFAGAVGMNGATSPPVGIGWDLPDTALSSEIVLDSTGEPARFSYLGKRDFHCPAGHTARLTSSEFADYRIGRSVTIVCTICGAAESLRKE